MADQSKTTIPLLGRGDTLIRFAARTPLPPSYTVQWWEQDEHCHWVLSENVYSDACWDKWACWRGAWNHFRKGAETHG